MRPVIKPALHKIWRDHHTLQIGLDPDRAVVITGLDRPLASVIEILDGTHDVPRVLDKARSVGVAESDVRSLLDLLAQGDVLDDAAADRGALAALPTRDRDRLAPDLASASLVRGGQDGGMAVFQRRRRSSVTVHGAGRVGASVATLLAAAGIGSVHVEDAGRATVADAAPAGLAPEAAGERRGLAARAAVRRVDAAVADAPAAPRPDVVVFAPASGAPDPRLVDDLVREGVPHVLAVVRETTGVVGPLVLPGRSTCLRCCDLHRSDRDRAWPRIAAQLVGARTGVPACDVVLATTVAGHAALQVLLWLDGTPCPEAVDGTLEVSAVDGTTRRRTWQPHPACGCAW